MTVSAILKLKGPDIVTIDGETTLRDAIKCLSENRIGAVIVAAAGGKVEGILSERDVVRLLAERGIEALDTPVASVMTRAVVTCTPDETIPEIMERMTRGRFRHVPVLEGERLVGIVSIGDVVKYRVQEMERESEALRTYIMTA